MKSFQQFPNIAFIMPSLVDMSPSGVTTFVRQMAAGFKRYGKRFRIVEIPHGDYAPEVSEAQCSACVLTGKGEKSAARVTLSIFIGYLKLLWIDIRRVWAVRGQCRHRIILTNQFGCETLPIALRVVFPFARIVAISHTHPGHGAEATHWVRRWVEHACYWSLNDILYNSDSSRRQWAGKLGIPSSKGQVIHLGTESPDLSVPDDYPARSIGVVDFLCVARFVSWKGQGNLVRVWSDVQRQSSIKAPLHNNLTTQQPDNLTTDRGARLIFIGDGPCLDAVRRDADEAGLGSCVVIMGGRPNADRYFNAADVAVLFSSEPEAFGLTLLEAMSRGKPVLASRMGGIPEIVVDGETGLLVSPHDDEKVADCVCALAASATERQRLGSNARKRWEDHFTVERMICRYESYFMGLDMKGMG